MEVGLLTFVLFKPDAFLRNQIGPILSYFLDLKLEIVEYYSARLSEKQFTLMYEDTFSWQLDDWEHNKKLFDFGPSLGVMLRSQTQDLNPTELLRSLKGSALPFERSKVSIRALFGSRSRTCSLLHIADSHEKSIKEALSWFCQKEVATLLTRPAILSKTVLQDIARQGYDSDPHLDPELAFIRSKIRFFHSLEKRNTFVDASLSHFYADWIAATQGVCSSHGIEGSRIKRYYEQEEALLHPLTYRSESVARWYSLLQSVQNTRSNAIYLDNYFIFLERFGVFLFPLEKYLISSRLKYG
jgi:nucleoside diphosphate kinase